MLGNRSALTEFGLITAGIYSLHFIYGVLHEKLAQHPYTYDGELRYFDFYLAGGAISAACTTLTAMICIVAARAAGQHVNRTPAHVPTLALMSIAHALATPLIMRAAKLAPYPLYLCVRMGGMIPAIIAGRLIYGRRHTTLKYTSAVFISIGAVVFTYQTPDSSPGRDDESDHPVGAAMTLLCAAALLEAFGNSAQDHVYLERQRAHPLWMMWDAGLAKLATMCVLLVVCEWILLDWQALRLFRPELREASRFLVRVPDATRDVVALGTLAALSKILVFTGLRHYGNSTILAITNTRKMGSILLSVIIFRHPLTVWQWAGLGAALCGGAAELLDVTSERKKWYILNKNK